MKNFVIDNKPQKLQLKLLRKTNKCSSVKRAVNFSVRFLLYLYNLNALLQAHILGVYILGYFPCAIVKTTNQGHY